MKILIVQFHPIELYPPVQNLLNAIQNELPTNSTLKVYTTESQSNDTFELKDSRIKIERLSSYTLGERTFKRYFLYLKFYVLSFFKIIKYKPNKILYFEAISSLSPLLFKRVHPEVELYIHYHEYISPEEYKSGILNRILHKLETKVYKKAEWISHTNSERMNLFLKDIGMEWQSRLHILPNYPPKAWQPKKHSNRLTSPVKVVYAGALGLDSMYIKEFAEWVTSQDGKVLWDIYSIQNTNEVSSFLKTLGTTNISIKGPVNYYQLPKILKGYDAGVILYKATTANYKFNAPNKLFEYLACGLDVWFPNVMVGCLPFVTEDVFPKVISIDFTNLGSFDYEGAIQKDDLKEAVNSFYCEEACNELFKKLISS